MRVGSYVFFKRGANPNVFIGVTRDAYVVDIINSQYESYKNIKIKPYNRDHINKNWEDIPE